MKTTEWKRVVRSLLPAAEAWEFRGSLCYRLPVHRVLLGVVGEGSGFDKGVYVWRVIMPLFVPSEHVVLSWSERIGGGSRKYQFDEEALPAAISAAMGGPGSDNDALVEMVRCDDLYSRNVLLHEGVAYARLLQGDATGARESLVRAAVDVGGPPWVQKITERVRLIMRLMDEGGPARAVDQLDRWCDQTAGALGLRRSIGGSATRI